MNGKPCLPAHFKEQGPHFSSQGSKVKGGLSQLGKNPAYVKALAGHIKSVAGGAVYPVYRYRRKTEDLL
jgi:hypothetical protein